VPLQPRHIDYENAQVLLIGSSKEDAFERATAPQPEDGEGEGDTPQEEMEKLEGEDERRIEHLKGRWLFLGTTSDRLRLTGEVEDDPIFEDLHLSSKEYSSTKTTW
jgi:hypothetical protein